jgi:hypothetical protein
VRRGLRVWVARAPRLLRGMHVQFRGAYLEFFAQLHGATFRLLTAENGTFGTRCLNVGCRVFSYTSCIEAIAVSRPMCYAWLDVQRCTDIPWMYRV